MRLCPDEPAVEIAGQDGEERKRDADLEEVGGLDLIALLLQNADGRDIGRSADGRQIAAERRADEQAEVQNMRIAAHHSRKANTARDSVTGDLWPFMEIVPDGDGYKFLRTSAESQWLGVKADDIDGWYNSEQYRCFRSSVT